jgi:hypothetical protein
MLKLVFEKSHFSSRLEIAVATNSLVMLMVALKKIGKLYEHKDEKASQIAPICIFDSLLKF